MKIFKHSNSKPKMSSRKRFSDEEKEELWVEYYGQKLEAKCPVGCGFTVTPFDFECGHIQAHSNKGSDDIDNLAPICDKCNKSMQNNNLIDFIQEHGFETPSSVLKRKIRKAERQKIKQEWPIQKTGPKTIKHAVKKAIWTEVTKDSPKRTVINCQRLGCENRVSVWNCRYGKTHPGIGYTVSNTEILCQECYSKSRKVGSIRKFEINYLFSSPKLCEKLFYQVNPTPMNTINIVGPQSTITTFLRDGFSFANSP